MIKWPISASHKFIFLNDRFFRNLSSVYSKLTVQIAFQKFSRSPEVIGGQKSWKTMICGILEHFKISLTRTLSGWHKTHVVWLNNSNENQIFWC